MASSEVGRAALYLLGGPKQTLDIMTLIAEFPETEALCFRSGIHIY